jgi:hypothetical protein
MDGEAGLNGFDLAEAIFGTVNDGRRTKGTALLPVGAHRARVSFDDAMCTSPSPFLPGEDGRRYPSILSTPKPTSYQMYLVQPNSLGRDRVRMKENLLAWDAATPDEGGAQSETTTLRGFKRYWHRGAPPDWNESPPDAEASDKFRAGALFRKPPTKHVDQYTGIRPVRAGAQFKGRVRFENLSRLEFGALLAALELPSSCRHQIGMGRPHGMGSVRISMSVTLYDPKARYSNLASIPALGDQGVLVGRAHDEFRRSMVGHHNGSVVSPKLEDNASLFDIPRLGALREMLEWDAHPDRKRTENQSLGGFKDRLPLPSPFGVKGKPAPPVDGEVPRCERAPADEAATDKGSALREAAEPETASAGTVVRFAMSGIKLRTDDGKVITVPVSLDVFPIAAWKRMAGGQFPAGRKVRITRVGKRVVKVLPE